MYAFVGGYDEGVAYRRNVVDYTYGNFFCAFGDGIVAYCTPIEVSAVVGDGVGVVGSFVDIEQLMVGLSEGCCLSERLYLAIAENKVA